MSYSEDRSKATNKTKHIVPVKLIDNILSWFFIVGIGIGICLFTKTLLRDQKGNTEEELTHSYSFYPSLMPWQSIGGCGAGGSGGGSDGIKWVGEGVTGGLLEVEILPRYNFGRNFHFLTIPPRFSVKPKWNTEIGLILPFASKTAEVQYRKNQASTTVTTGGVGDITLDVTRTFGSEGQFSLMLGLTFPTGQYDIRRGAEEYFVPINLQMGRGVYNAALTFYYLKDVESGLWLFEGSFNYPFNMRPVTKENRFLDEYYAAYKGQKSNERFYYRFKPYGESDLGDYVPPSVNAGVIYAYRGVQNYVHSFGFSFLAPLGVAWIHSEKSDTYDPRPDPDHKAWQVILVYGLEFSRPNFPVFIAFALPIIDKAPKDIDPDNEYDPKPMEKWNAPDWEDLFQQWTVGVGIKSAMF